MSGPELCVSAVVVDDDRLLLVRRGRGRAQGTWALPGGRVEDGELLVEAVVRELVTETGVEGVCGPLVGIVELVEGDGPHQVVLAHEVTLLESAEPVAGDDAAEARWVDLGEVVELALAPGLAEFLHDHEVIATIT
ncbi:MAG: NUDIX domain-containing protein [Acidimicrobiales bacterium]|nr:NUDIX domain-containing protein [Acidimicrobiales bacterium]